MINRMVKGAILATAGVISVSLIAACAGGGVSQSNFDDLEAQVTSIESALDTANSTVAGLTTLVTSVLDCTATPSGFSCLGSRVLNPENAGSPGGFLERAYNREFAGTSVSIFGPCRDQCETDYNLILDQFEPHLL